MTVDVRKCKLQHFQLGLRGLAGGAAPHQLQQLLGVRAASTILLSSFSNCCLIVPMGPLTRPGCNSILLMHICMDSSEVLFLVLKLCLSFGSVAIPEAHTKSDCFQETILPTAVLPILLFLLQPLLHPLPPAPPPQILSFSPFPWFLSSNKGRYNINMNTGLVAGHHNWHSFCNCMMVPSVVAINSNNCHSKKNFHSIWILCVKSYGTSWWCVTMSYTEKISQQSNSTLLPKHRHHPIRHPLHDVWHDVGQDEGLACSSLQSLAHQQSPHWPQ